MPRCRRLTLALWTESKPVPAEAAWVLKQAPSQDHKPLRFEVVWTKRANRRLQHGSMQDGWVRRRAAIGAGAPGHFAGGAELRDEDQLQTPAFARVGKYQDLPGGVFRRGMVRAYLKAVALDEQAWLERFDRSAAEHTRMLGLNPDADKNAWVEFASNVKRNRTTGRQRRDWRWFGVLILLGALGLSAWAVWSLEVRRLVRVEPLSRP